jgi:plasmid stabilization system protein ParE
MRTASSSSVRCERNVKLRIGKRAQQQVDKIEAWWVENRPDAPTLFIDELEESFQYICDVRSAGVRWPTPHRPRLRRLLMTRTKNHIYFVIDEATETVHVHAVWGAPRARAPKL